MSDKPRSLDDDSEQQAAISDAELDALLAGSFRDLDRDPLARDRDPLQPGDEVEGTVVAVSDDEVLLEMGKMSGAIPRAEFGDAPPTVGDRVRAIFQRFDDERELALLGVEEVIRELFLCQAKVGMVVEGPVTESNRGGVVLLVRGHRVFVPVSQIDSARVEDPATFVGRTLRVEITDIDHERGELVGSRRQILRREEAARREQRIGDFAVEQRHRGTVRNLTEFGAFVDLGGIDGLVHASKLRRHGAAGELAVGQQVEVEVTAVDVERGRIGLDLVVTGDEGAAATTGEFEVGEEVTALIARVRPEGAYLLLGGEEGGQHVEGFIPGEAGRSLSPGELVRGEVRELDAAAGRVILRLRY